MSLEDKTAEAEAELQRLDMVLEVAKRNGNQLFINNIQERSGSRPGREDDCS
jgi:hypothetical protein